MNLQKSKIGFYFHIPFCPHICPYCDFTKTKQFQKKDIDIYFEQLEIQLDFFLSKLENSSTSDKPFATAYFGGGTPGLFKSHFYKPLLEKLKIFYSLEEITLETNPYTNYEKNFSDYKNAGFTRLTLGAQSLCPQTLKTLGRKHTPQDVLKNLHWAKNAGFDNIQVDLIYGLKKDLRTIHVEDEIRTLKENGATGISAYFLTLEKRTLFANSNLVDEDNGVEEYFKTLEQCKLLGFKQLETSNFSQFPAIHNNLYWYGHPYIGIGTGAHGLLPSTKENPYGLRYKIGQPVESHAPGDDILIFKDSEKCKKNFEIIYDEPRTLKEFIQENIFTLLRTPEGLNLPWLEKISGQEDLVQKLQKHAKFSRGLQEGKLLFVHNHLVISAQEKIRGDSWALEFISLLT